MVIDQMAIDDSHHTVVRSRVDRATACWYPSSQRIVLIADRGDIDAAQTALTELRQFLGWVSPTSLVPAGALKLDELAAAMATVDGLDVADYLPRDWAPVIDAADAVLASAGYLRPFGHAKGTLDP